MIFTSSVFFLFFGIVFILYWLIGVKKYQNVLLLASSYVFYGWIHPWFCILIASSTVADYFIGLQMKRTPHIKRRLLITSLLVNLGLLGFFKYFNFFAENVQFVLNNLGLNVSELSLKIFLPVGISFYTFQTLSYSIDIYRGQIEPRTNFIDFAVFVSFFPQLVAGPIERAKRFLPQIEKKRKFEIENFELAFPLLIRGYVKKLVIADNISIYADKVFMLESPSFLLLFAGTLAFALQIFADFSAYTDIARGVARLLGFDLVKNFKHPYLAISPSDFWRRWHISFSSWIRDYLYISLGGSRVSSQFKFAFILIITLGLSGLWHGAEWNYVIWGLYHGILVFVYHWINRGGRWQPKTQLKHIGAWLLMSIFTIIGWMIFRSSSMGWLFNSLSDMSLGFSGDSLIVSIVILAFILFYSLPLFIFYILDNYIDKFKIIHSVVYGFALVAIIIFARESGQDFIYFQF